jgi:hypothetical protein
VRTYIISLTDPRFQSSASMLMRSVLFWDITQRRVVIIYRCFGTTYLSHLQGSRSPRRKELLHFDFLTLEDGTIRCPETSVKDCYLTLCNIPEARRSHHQRTARLKCQHFWFKLGGPELKSRPGSTLSS